MYTRLFPLKINTSMNQRCILFLALIGLTCTAIGQDLQKDFNTSSISIFKNGSAFFIKSGTVKVADKVYRITENLPPALFGTYWVLSPNSELDFLNSSIDTLKEAKKIEAHSIMEMITANVGKKAKLHLKKGDEIIGLIEAVGKMNQGSQLGSARQILKFRMDSKWVILTMNEIRRIEFFEEPNSLLDHKTVEVKPTLEVNFTTDKSEQDLDIMYLSKGLSWTPMYLLELLAEEKARLSLRAEVVNQIEDITDTDVNFVVGVPNFKHANKLSPLIDFREAGFVRPRASSDFNPFSNAAISQQRVGYAVLDDTFFETSETSSGLEGKAAEDLYFYTLEDMHLKKGGRGHYPVFTADIKIAHIYESNLPQNNNNRNFYKAEYLFSPDVNKVFHSIKVVNDTKYPFTTGPIMVIKQGEEAKPISQDQLNYTSVNGNSFVKLTEAPDVRIKQGEKALKKIDRAKTLTSGNNVYYYDLIMVEGQVQIKNFKTKKIDLNVRRTILGELQKSSEDWLKAERVNTNGDLNKLTDVCWETSLDPGEELKITYTYQIYVRD